MTKQEIIENLKTQIEEMKSLLDIKDPVDNNSLFAEDIRALKEVINLIEKQEKMINEMIDFIFDLRDCPMEDCEFDCDCENRCNNENETVKECWRIYFEKKVSE